MRASCSIAWTRATPWLSRFVWAASDPVGTLALVPPIRSREARETNVDAWPRWFAHRIAGSERAWLAPGTWTIAAMRSRADGPRTEHVPPGSEAIPSVARGLATALDLPACFVGAHPHNGSGIVIPLRRASPADAARVKAWRKHTREGTLPPVLLGWVGLLDAWVVLDGHDRLLAARLERALPEAVALFGVREDRASWTAADRDRTRGRALETYARVFAAEPRLQDRTRLDANRGLVGAFSDYLWRRSWTPATFRQGLAERLASELATRPLPDDVRDALLR